MRGKRANDHGLELLKLLARHGTLFDFQFGGEQAAQRVTLVDGKRGNDTARIRDGFQPLSLTRRQFHSIPPFQESVTIELKMLNPKSGTFYCSISSLRRHQGVKNPRGLYSFTKKGALLAAPFLSNAWRSAIRR